MKPNLPARRLIPKWRPMRRTLATKEAADTSRSGVTEVARARTSRSAQTAKSSSPGGLPVDLDEFERAVALWNKHKELGMLGDILSFSIDASLHERIVEIGTQALRSDVPVTPAQRFVICHLANSTSDAQSFKLPEPSSSDNEETQPFAEAIRGLRALLRTDPGNALALLDFAQLQTAIGRNSVAEKALRTALGAAPNNRLVLRSLARFYVHTGNYDRAHQLVRRHERTPHDPWLLASEIALADLAGSPSSFLAKGRRMVVTAGKMLPPNFTELAGSLAMTELCSGSLRKARELQRLALLDPTDNVAAQAVDREHQFGIALSAPSVTRAIASSAEAQLLQSWFRLAPKSLEQHALDWHIEEPFSSRPIQLLTTLYAYQGETEKAQRWLQAGLQTDHEDLGLLINLAYVQARVGSAAQARLTILRTRRLHGEQAEPFLRATEGLLAYQLGRFEEGDQLYTDAVELFERITVPRANVSTYCLLNQAIVALEHEHPRVAEIVARTNEALAARPNPDAIMMLKVTVSAGIAPPSPAPLSHHRQRLTSQWVFDPKSNTLTERRGLSAPGANPILLLGDPRSDR